jgi:hypothetical protein
MAPIKGSSSRTYQCDVARISLLFGAIEITTEYLFVGMATATQAFHSLQLDSVRSQAEPGQPISANLGISLY